MKIIVQDARWMQKKQQLKMKQTATSSWNHFSRMRQTEPKEFVWRLWRTFFNKFKLKFWPQILRFTKKEDTYMNVQSKMQKDRTCKQSHHWRDWGQKIQKMRLYLPKRSAAMKKWSKMEVIENANLGVSWDPVHVTIKITTRYFICQRPWTFTWEEYSVLCISNDRF